MPDSTSYRDAGVNIDEADKAVSAIRRMARSTFTRGVISDIGSFGACFSVPKMRQPVLVSSIDGVGTKLKIAFAAGRHDTVGEDLVNHCVNDIAVQGAMPLFFLDYFATGKLDHKVAAQLISGMARGCKSNGCALIGGETAEMPGMYSEGEYDVAGAIVGIVGKPAMLGSHKVKSGDILVALPSSGLHTNGYSLARKLLFDTAKLKLDSTIPDTGLPLADELLKVHRSYLKILIALIKAGAISAAAHITGGGITDNLPRVLPKHLAAGIELNSWKIPAIFEMLRSIGKVPDADWRRTFNLGVGMVVVVPRAKIAAAQRTLKRAAENFWFIGEVFPRRRGRPAVEYR